MQDGLSTRRRDDVSRIRAALQAAAEVFRAVGNRREVIASKGKRGPLTHLDRAINERLLGILPRGDEGWLSEETADDPRRAKKRRVWIVDPLDGTREFVQGVPEFCISIGLVEEGIAVAGGVLNPATSELFLGARETGVVLNGKAARPRQLGDSSEAVVLVSRHEVGQKKWPAFNEFPFQLSPVGSIAYKLALVAAGLADATWSFTPKHEWDVAGGVALVIAAGGSVTSLEGKAITFNRPVPWLDGLVAFAPQENRAVGRRLLNCWNEQRVRFVRHAEHASGKRVAAKTSPRR